MTNTAELGDTTIGVETDGRMGGTLLLEYCDIEKGLIGSCVVVANLDVNWLLEVFARLSE